jgi:hypothetical protein
MREISITINNVKLKASLLDTSTADAIYYALPIEGRANIWGDEIYFGIPVEIGEENNAVEEVETGTLAFWPPGSAFCIFFGRTPASNGDKPRAASSVNVFGKIEGDLKDLKQAKHQYLVQVKKL